MAESLKCEVCGTKLRNGRIRFCSDFCYKFGSSKLYQVYREVEGGSISYCDLINKIRLVYGIKSYEKVDERLTEFFRLVGKIRDIRIGFGNYG